MSRILLKFVVVIIPLLIGCAAFEEWKAGEIVEGIPKMRKKLPKTVKVCSANPVNARGYALHERNRKQVQDAFVNAFDTIGVVHSTETNGCSHILKVVVDSWEYGDSGLLGSGARNKISMSVILQNADTDRVLTRTSLYATNLDLLIMKYVKTLFENEK
jgi:hypothetical protein